MMEQFEKQTPIARRFGFNPRFFVGMAVIAVATLLAYGYFKTEDWAAFSIAITVGIGLTVLFLLGIPTAIRRLAYIVCAFMAVCWFGIAISQVESVWNPPPLRAQAVVSCVVGETPELIGDDKIRFFAEQISIDNERSDFCAIVTVTLSEDSTMLRVESGMGLIFTPSVVERVLPDDAGRLNASDYRRDIGYRLMTSDAGIMLHAESNKSVGLTIRASATKLLNAVMQPEHASIAVALLFGDKSIMSDTVENGFRVSGLAHVLAVSGLHVGFLVLILNKLLKKVKLPRIVKFACLTAALVFYAYLCGFSPSVMRACIMGIAAAFAQTIGERNDGFNNLGLAAVLILAAKPLYLFDLGFQLSFLSTFGILALAPVFDRALRRTRCPKKLASGIAVSAAAMLMILPIIAAVFRTINLWTILVNLIAAPLVMATYTVTLVAVTLVVINPVMLLVLKCGELLYLLLTMLTSVATAWPGSEFVLFDMSTTAVVYYGSLFVLSRFFLAPRIPKAILTSVAAVASVCVIVFCNFPHHYEGGEHATTGNYDKVSMAVLDDGSVVVIGECTRYAVRAAEDMLISAKIREIDIVVATSYEAEDFDALNRFSARFGAKRLIVGATDGLYADAFEVYALVSTEGEPVVTMDYVVTAVFDRGIQRGATVSYGDFHILFLNGNYNGVQLPNLPYRLALGKNPSANVSLVSLEP